MDESAPKSTGEYGEQPLYYAEFTALTELAALRGEAADGPFDPNCTPGDDGTLTPDGQRAHGFSYVLQGDELPSSLADKAIVRAEIGYYVSVVLDGGIVPEQAWLVLDESNGISKDFVLSRDPDGRYIGLKLSVEAVLSDNLPQEADPLDSIQKEATTAELFAGNTDNLHKDGPIGDFARMAHSLLTEPDEPTMDDVELLRSVITDIRSC